MRGDRLIVETAVPAGVNQAGKELGVVAMAGGLAEEARQGVLRAAGVGLERGVELVRDRQPRIERNRALERVFRQRLAVGQVLDELADHAVTTAKVGPGRCETRI